MWRGYDSIGNKERPEHNQFPVKGIELMGKKINIKKNTRYCEQNMNCQNNGGEPKKNSFELLERCHLIHYEM